MEKKMNVTKAIVLEAMKAVFEDLTDAIEVDGVQVTAEDMISYCDTTITQLQNKALKASAKAAENKQKGDEMREAIYMVITGEFQDVDTITAAVNFEGVTRNKVVARLKQLLDAGMVEKGEIKVDKSKKVAYRLPEKSAVDSFEE